jgi:hypothetical protein
MVQVHHYMGVVCDMDAAAQNQGIVPFADENTLFA